MHALPFALTFGLLWVARTFVVTCSLYLTTQLNQNTSATGFITWK